MTMTDWQAWHERYADPESWQSQRLRSLQGLLADLLTAAPAGPIRVVSACAGDGRDLLDVLVDHPRRADVVGRLVELDPVLADVARSRAGRLDVRLDVRTCDAALTDNYAGVVPADIVMLCGIFGNITEADIERTIDACSSLCATGGIVVWTRHRQAPDRVPLICSWFTDRGYDEVFVSPPVSPVGDPVFFGIGAHRFTGVPAPLPAGERFFTFIL